MKLLIVLGLIVALLVAFLIVKHVAKSKPAPAPATAPYGTVFALATGTSVTFPDFTLTYTKRDEVLAWVGGNHETLVTYTFTVPDNASGTPEHVFTGGNTTGIYAGGQTYVLAEAPDGQRDHFIVTLGLVPK